LVWTPKTREQGEAIPASKSVRMEPGGNKDQPATGYAVYPGVTPVGKELNLLGQALGL
jgi:hypothetical protein